MLIYLIKQTLNYVCMYVNTIIFGWTKNQFQFITTNGLNNCEVKHDFW